MKNSNHYYFRYIIRFLTISFILICVSCGGGGGGGGTSGAAFIRINAEPRVIDSGDRITITIDVSDIHESGILLKIRFPTALEYVPGTAFITPDGGDDYDATPNNSATSGNNSFLVFFLTKDDFDSRDRGEVTFELAGNEPLADGTVEIDADVNDEAVPDELEFDVEAPEFAAEDEVHVIVED